MNYYLFNLKIKLHYVLNKKKKEIRGRNNNLSFSKDYCIKSDI